ncbi:MAG: GIY-YIG nuclease family protein [Kiritimatiellia bacterium]
MTPFWHFYVIRTISGALYAGIATDVQRRYEEHLSASPRAAKFLRANPPHALVFKRRIGSHSLALKVEYRFKQLPKAAKEALIAAGKMRINRTTGAIDG